MFRFYTAVQYLFFAFILASFPSNVCAQDSDSNNQEQGAPFNQHLLDSLEQTYSNLNESDRIKQVVKHCREFGYFYPKEILSLIDKTVREARKSKNERAEIELLFQKIYLLSNKGPDLENSKEICQYILENLPATIEEQGDLIDFIARTHLAKAELIEAQDLYVDALERLKKMDRAYSSAHANIYWGIAVTYSESRNYEKSSEYYLKCLDQSLHQQLHFMASSCYQNLADNARKMKQWKTARGYLDSSKNTINKIPNKSDKVISEMGLFNAYGDYFKSIKKLDSAEIYLVKSIELGEKFNDLFTVSYAKQSLGSVYLEQNRLDEAEELFLESQKIFNESTPSLLVENSGYLYQLYKKKGRYDESLKWHEIYTNLSDSIQKVDNVKTIAQATSKYEAELKDKTIDLLKKEKIVEAQSKEKYKRQWQIIIVLLLLLLVIAAFYLNHNRHQKNRKKIINQVLGEERERARISMDLHDGVCSEITTISRAVKNGDEMEDTSWRKKVAEKLDNLNLTVRDISHNLSLIKYDQQIPFEHIVEDYIGDLQETIPIKFTIKFTPENEDIFLEPNRELVLFRVIQEICNNAIKYSQTETMNFEFIREDHNLFIRIRDYGIGFDNPSSGNGIRNIFERIEFLNGKVQLDTKNNGVAFNIQIPLLQTELSKK